jgi:hypothetical protein
VVEAAVGECWDVAGRAGVSVGWCVVAWRGWFVVSLTGVALAGRRVSPCGLAPLPVLAVTPTVVVVAQLVERWSHATWLVPSRVITRPVRLRAWT